MVISSNLRPYIPALYDKNSPDYVEIVRNIPFISSINLVNHARMEV